MNPVVVITTCPKGQGDKLKEKIVKRKLGACVSIFQVKSTYWWQDNITSDNEDMLIIKTLDEKLEALFGLFKEIHPYTVPEFIVIPVKIVGPYLKWLKEVLTENPQNKT
ncbi:MAG: divalent-cation tolerance protein CutA [Thermoplasmata archaeon]|nr:MAG: divalent-cation tolerance protein CutA [Thermoplasmata archaeon]